MTTDITRRIDAVTRKVSHREHEGKPANGVAATCTYEATVDDLWDAISNAERIPRWFLPISGELQVGGRFQLEGNAGGEITRCEPPRHFAVTWEFGGETSWVYVSVEPEADDRARLTLEHVAPADEHWDEYGPGAAGVGWELGLLGLDAHMASGESVDPEAAAAWMASSEGAEFIRQSSDAWRLAAVAAGTDEATAAARAERTTAFYTGAGQSGASE